MFRKKNRYFQLGITLLMVIIISVLFYVTLTHIGDVSAAVRHVVFVFSPVLFGGIFAYLMNPLMMFIEKQVRRIFARSNMTERGLNRLSRALGVTVSLLLFIAVIYGLIAMVVPQLYKSIAETFSPENLQSSYVKVTAWLTRVFKGTPVENWLITNNPLKTVINWVNKLEIDFSTIAAAFTGAYDVVRVIINLLIGVVISVYLLCYKERFQGQSKKLTVALFKQKTADRIFEIARLTNRRFGGFIMGKLVDSLIIGVLSYIGMLILGLPYALVASVFIGVSNIIPCFGPIIGLVIGGLLILLQNPLDALYFVILELILQQVDANIIGPRILGNRLGISDFWILVSVTVFTGLFGFPGMLFGVPVFAILYSLIAEAVNNAIKKKELPLASERYYSILAVEDLEGWNKDSEDATVFQSGDTFATEYDPDEDIEYDDPDQK